MVSLSLAKESALPPRFKTASNKKRFHLDVQVRTEAFSTYRKEWAKHDGGWKVLLRWKMHTSILKTIISSLWILEGGYLRRKKRKNSEGATDQAYQKKRHPGLKPACVLPSEQQRFTPKHGSRGYEKDSNVEPISASTQDAGIGVVNHRDQHQSQQNPCQLNTPEVRILLS